MYRTHYFLKGTVNKGQFLQLVKNLGLIYFFAIGDSNLSQYYNVPYEKVILFL